MSRKAFLLGLFSIGGQVLLLRELIASLNGDELFVGTALFGWLAAVALGAVIGGKAGSLISANGLFLAGCILLPLTIILARLTPHAMTGTVGQVLPFLPAALLSIAVMLPVGLISGWLFTAITNQGYFAAESVVRVYLFEGLGAFVGGLAVTFLVATVLSTLGLAVGLVSVVICGNWLLKDGRVRMIVVIGLLAALVVIEYLIPRANTVVDTLRYRPYEVEASLDTKYTHQTILSRDSSLVLVTDNTIEATYPEHMSTENQLLPPMLYNPDAARVLFIGRAEFGAAQLANRLPGVELFMVDPRRSLSDAIDRLLPIEGEMTREIADPVDFMRQTDSRYDIIIVNAGALDTFRGSRLLTTSFLARARNVLSDSGIVIYPSPYDSDRYLSPEKSNVLSIVNNTFESAFDTTVVWPGEMTLFLGFRDKSMVIPLDSIVHRAENIADSAAYVTPDFLADRFEPMKVKRLRNALSVVGETNTIDKPVLPEYQAIFRAKSTGSPLPLVLVKGKWLWFVALLILVAIVVLVSGRESYRTYSLFLYFIAGIVSLSLELVSFYLYQASAGSLYSELAALVGAFMLGLAFGTFYAEKVSNPNLAYPALILLIIAVSLFLITYNLVTPRLLLIYHMMFQFTVALATGTLFVAATARYYHAGVESNRGIGYAIELAGSSLGALLALTVALPALGVRGLLLALGALLMLALVGTAAGTGGEEG